ncbi:hypothetical protein [Cohnella terricola]|uniref:Glycosyltransferase RgtA/B/C/D-like domain-containing protein n=1 Tax=Cohnella terricola TaxID=1289167 RepID=A0A559JB11_9BACL|nr:hypothetical protein [Cohnella terricola]TVX97070.1 hypothetical protein FPZ45_19105 [Cohnella terricola]
MKKINPSTLFPYMAGVLAWMFVVYPSLIQVDWFYLDTATFTQIGKNLFNTTWLIPDETGRYIPFFWFYYAVTYFFFADDLFWYFLIQSCITLLITLLIIYISKWMSKSNLIAIFAVFLFFTCSPVAENVYTIGKQEHLILFFILLLVFFQIRYIQSTSRIKKILALAGGVLSTLLACWSKETSLVIAVYAIAAGLISFMLDKRYGTTQLKGSLYYYVGVVAAVIASKLPGLLFQKGDASYTSYVIDLNLILNNIKFYFIQQPDVIITGLLALCIAAFMLWKRARFDQELPILIGMLAMAWSYLGGLLIWRWSLGYYLYAIAAIFVLVLSVLIGRFRLISIRNRTLILVCVMLATGATRLYSIPYNVFMASTQTTMAELYSDAIKHYVNTAQSGQRLIIENWAFYQEPTTLTNTLVAEIYGRKDLKVDGIRDIFDPSLVTPEIQKLYRFNEIPKTDDRMPKVNDYILLLKGHIPAYWVLRGTSPFMNDTSIFKNEGMDLKLVAQDRVDSKSIYVDYHTKMPVFGDTYIGYELYQVVSSNFVKWTDRQPDGWIGKTASVELNPQGRKEVSFKVMLPSVFSSNEIRFWVDGVLCKEAKLDKPGESIIAIPISSAEANTVKIDIEVQKTFIPKEHNINTDERTLGVTVDVVK